jgi:hypothetical protein
MAAIIFALSILSAVVGLVLLLSGTRMRSGAVILWSSAIVAGITLIAR